MKILMFLMITVVSACAQTSKVSLVELISNREKFDGKIVQIVGVLDIDPEFNAIYLSKEHEKFRVHSLGVLLELSSKLVEERKWASGKYVVIEGKFSASERGVGGMWSGSVTDVEKIYVHESASVEKSKTK